MVRAVGEGVAGPRVVLELLSRAKKWQASAEQALGPGDPPELLARLKEPGRTDGDTPLLEWLHELKGQLDKMSASVARAPEFGEEAEVPGEMLAAVSGDHEAFRPR